MCFTDSGNIFELTCKQSKQVVWNDIYSNILANGSLDLMSHHKHWSASLISKFSRISFVSHVEHKACWLVALVDRIVATE